MQIRSRHQVRSFVKTLAASLLRANTTGMSAISLPKVIPVKIISEMLIELVTLPTHPLTLEYSNRSLIQSHGEDAGEYITGVSASDKTPTHAMPSLPMVPRYIPLVLKRIA